MPGFSDKVMYADNVRFDGTDYPGQVTTDGQLLIGATVAPNIRVGTLGAGSNMAVTPGAGTLSVATVTSPTFTSVTINNPPVSTTDATNKAYVDAIAAGFDFKNTTIASTTGPLNAAYFNGVAGVGATLTNAGALAVFSIDGQLPTVTQRVLIKDQASTLENGIYTVTDVGDAISVPWVLTRATDYDTPAEMTEGSIVPVQNGTQNVDTLWLQNTIVTNIGIDAITYQKFQSAPIVTTQHAILIGDIYNKIASLGPLTNGQLAIGNTGNDPTAATLTAGAGISITNAAGSITVAAIGDGVTWSVIAADQPAVVNEGYFCNKAGTLALSLPAVSAIGDTIMVANINTANGISFTQGAGQRIFIGDTSTTLGGGGSLTSTKIGDSLTIVCRAVNTLWQVTSSVGSWTVV